MMFNHMLFLVTFQIDPSLFTWSKLLSHITFSCVCQKCICPYAFTAPFVLTTSLPMLLCGTAVLTAGAVCLCMVSCGYFF